VFPHVHRQTLPLAMRVLSWIGAVVLVAVLSTGAAAALHPHKDTAYALTAARPALAIPPNGSVKLDPTALQRLVPSPSPTSEPAPPQRAQAAPSIVVRSTQQALINQDRAAAGLGPLSWSNCLYSVAASNAGRLSQQGWVPPYHTNGPTVDLGCGLGNHAGENVGYWSAGINDPKLNTMFMNSAEHHANIMGPYHYVATAWAVASNGYAYVAVEFS